MWQSEAKESWGGDTESLDDKAETSSY